MSLNSEIGSIAWAGLTGYFGATDCPGEMRRRQVLNGKQLHFYLSFTEDYIARGWEFFHLVFLS